MPATRTRMSAVVGRLAGINVLIAALGFVTGPLLARALGPEGRGDLAAILVPLALAPSILGLALPYYANREIARGADLRVIIGSIGAPLLAIGAIAAACAFPAATLLAEGRETVRVWLVVVFLTLPLGLLGGLLMGSLQGQERWGRLIIARMIAFGVPFVATVVLFVAGRLTVATAAAFTIAGALLTLLPVLSLLFERGRPVSDAAVTREGIGFGLRTWFGGLAYLANVRLDQLVMITAVAPRELGLYSVAATLAGASALFTGAITPPLLSRTAAGDVQLLPQTLRITLLITASGNLLLALIAPLLLRVVFGHEFVAATGMSLVLLAAAVPLAGGTVIGASLQGAGAPGIPSLAEGVALVITARGLRCCSGRTARSAPRSSAWRRTRRVSPSSSLPRAAAGRGRGGPICCRRARTSTGHVSERHGCQEEAR